MQFGLNTKLPSTMNSNIKECLQMAIDHFEKDIEAEKSKKNGDTIKENTYTKEDFMLTTENEYSKICEALEANAHFPTIHSYTLLKRKYQIELKDGNYKSAGMTLLYSQGITFHHQAMQQYSKRIWANEKSKRNKNAKYTEHGVKSEEEDIFQDASSEEDNELLWSKEKESYEQMLNRLLSFQTSPGTPVECMNHIKKLPKEWRIVQISADFPSNVANPFKFSTKDQGIHN